MVRKRRLDGLPFIYIDTNIFLAYFFGKEKEPKQYPLARAFLEEKKVCYLI